MAEVTQQLDNIFVIGLDDHQHEVLERLPQARRYHFHNLLGAERFRGVEQIDVEQLYADAKAQLEQWAGDTAAIISLLDFPATEIAALLCNEFALPGPNIEAVLRCNHKYWSRLIQHRTASQVVPQFTAFDPFDPAATANLENELDYPFWIKPMNAYRSLLGFGIYSRAQLDSAIEQLREGVLRLAEPFDWVLQRCPLPGEIAALPAHICIAESIIGGHQCTLEGYAHKGQAHIYAVVDSIREPNGVSFSRYQYPSSLPRDIQEYMADIAVRTVTATGLDQCPFNVEFFYAQSDAKVWLLEINPRLSQSHCELLEKVDGVSHQRIAIDLAQGRSPQIQYRRGRWPCAAKFFVRAYSPGQVTKVPSPERIRAIERLIPGAAIQLQVNTADSLAELTDQDSYSYELANIWLGGTDTDDLLARFARCRELLAIEIDS